MPSEGFDVLLLACFLGVPVLLVWTRFSGWLAGQQTAPRWRVLMLVLALPIAASLALDACGAVRPVKVVDKRDDVEVNRSGGWTRTLSVKVAYQAPGESRPTMLSLSSDAPTFDAIQVEQTVAVRLLDFGGWCKFARLQNQSTFSPLVRLMSRSPQGPWGLATAVVSEVHHITAIHHRGLGREVLRRPYSVVLLRFTPEGWPQPVIAVDVVETASVPGLSRERQLQVVWPVDDPRAALIAGARPGAPLASRVYYSGTMVTILGGGILIGGLGVFVLVRRVWRS
jgi:hypothetical protein